MTLNSDKFEALEYLSSEDRLQKISEAISILNYFLEDEVEKVWQAHENICHAVQNSLGQLEYYLDVPETKAITAAMNALDRGGAKNRGVISSLEKDTDLALLQAIKEFFYVEKLFPNQPDLGEEDLEGIFSILTHERDLPSIQSLQWSDQYLDTKLSEPSTEFNVPEASSSSVFFQGSSFKSFFFLHSTENYFYKLFFMDTMLVTNICSILFAGDIGEGEKIRHVNRILNELSNQILKRFVQIWKETVLPKYPDLKTTPASKKAKFKKELAEFERLKNLLTSEGVLGN